MELGTDCLCLHVIEWDIETLKNFQLGLHVTGQSSHGTVSLDAAETVCLIVGRVLLFKAQRPDFAGDIAGARHGWSWS
jgi:hypothetical protein